VFTTAHKTKTQTVTNQISTSESNLLRKEKKYTRHYDTNDDDKIAATHLLKWQLIGEFQSHHGHPGNPKEHDVTCSLQQVRRIKLPQVFSLQHKQTLCINNVILVHDKQ